MKEVDLQEGLLLLFKRRDSGCFHLPDETSFSLEWSRSAWSGCRLCTLWRTVTGSSNPGALATENTQSGMTQLSEIIVIR